MAGRDLRADEALTVATFNEDREDLLEGVSASVWWDVAATDADAATVQAAMGAAWDGAREYALGLAFDALKGVMTDFTPYGVWEATDDGDLDAVKSFGNYVDPIRAAASVACFVAQGAAYAAGVQARKALES